MKTITQEAYTNNLFTLLKETFEGPLPQTPSAYLDQGGGLFQTIDHITAEEAYHVVRPGSPTIAAHCNHVRYYIEVLYKLMGSPVTNVDWKQSWVVQGVSPSEWEKLKAELRGTYQLITEGFQSVENWGDVPVGHGMAILAHTAYHLGAIRQLMRAVA